ncbi:hypothetical protein GUITHDRAFT_142458 [Guillardia theta CCMP2712]|uniref:Uncharacterized protein n=1 Tax=Guillardia theta (strain CCMP2712) TaxID=905079 RepID=L1IX96_GUITC|nr:hypothetical protein GUITHDRAFT_142458 [Guillardia theta CCMP2712]EKX40836.1 hypothetical protein GUITHDRAFT_142458 [Guillardia theta CCMP2712]|eukprot:XP_005827816.1 hypothetical protein GUITHDRAFT_142458 [Guillardia theta CCMP2712]
MDTTQAVARVTQAMNEWLLKDDGVEKAQALVRLRQAEHDLAVLEGAESESPTLTRLLVKLKHAEHALAKRGGDKQKVAEALVKLRDAEHALAKQGGDKEKIAEALVRLKDAEHALAVEQRRAQHAHAQDEGNQKKIALALVRLREAEHAHAQDEGNQKKIALALVRLKEAELQTVANGGQGDLDRLSKELETARLALLSQQNDGDTSNFFSSESVHLPGMLNPNSIAGSIERVCQSSWRCESDFQALAGMP